MSNTTATSASQAISRRAVWLLTISISVFVVQTANAADAQAPLPEEAPIPGREWTFTVAPYLWAAGIDGKTGLFGQEPVEVDESFIDILKDFKFGGMIVAELHNGTWGIFGDVMYARTAADGGATRTVAGVPLTLSAEVETSSFTGTVMGEYRAYSTPTATLDLMAGARIWSVDNDIELTLDTGGPAIAALSGSDGSTWVDPMIGVRGRYNIDEKWFVNGWAMVGGFGAGSDVTWDLLGGFGYQWSDSVSFNFGYRALGVDYSDDGFVYDVVQHGIILGTVIKF